MDQYLGWYIFDGQGKMGVFANDFPMDAELAREIFFVFDSFIQLNPIIDTYDMAIRNEMDLFYAENELHMKLHSRNLRKYWNPRFAYECKVEISRRFVNYIVSARTFIEVTEKNIISREGRNSIKLKRWKVATEVLWKKYFEYRFVKVLRDFSAHHDIPISAVDFYTMGAFAKGDEIQVDFKVDPTEIFNKITSRSGLKGELKDDQANRNSLVSIVDLVKAHSDLLRRLFLFLCTMENGVINKSMNCLKAVANGMKPPVGAVPVIWLGQKPPCPYATFPFAELERFSLLRMKRGVAMPSQRPEV